MCEYHEISLCSHVSQEDKMTVRVLKTVVFMGSARDMEAAWGGLSALSYDHSRGQCVYR